MNTLLTPGKYYQSSSANVTSTLNYPNIGRAGSVEVTRTIEYCVEQRFTPYTSNQNGYYWVRYYDNFNLKGWTDWVRSVSFLDFDSSVAANGWQKLPSGIIIQWGTLSFASGAGRSGTLTFPIQFPSTVFSITGTDSGGACVPCGFGRVSLAAVTMFVANYCFTYSSASASAATATAAVGINWMAVGR